ncbi:MAG: hypothetical protein JW731_02785 [Bacteroidales bacterium]|nr:hypothetical protein [Bacteroidales bacterium]
MEPTHIIPSLSGIPIIIGSKTHKANTKALPKAFGIAKEPSSPSLSVADIKRHSGKIENNEYKT